MSISKTAHIGDDDWRNIINVESARSGGDPSTFFDILYLAVKDQVWTQLRDTNGNPITSFAQFIAMPYPDGCGIQAHQLFHLMKVEHLYEKRDTETREKMEWLREFVKGELKPVIEAEIPEANERGRPEKLTVQFLQGLKIELEEKRVQLSAEMKELLDAQTNLVPNVDMSTLGTRDTGGGNSRQYRIARLKRDAPDLAERVIADEISAAAGIRELDERLGRTKHKVAVNMDDVHSAAQTILKYMTDDQIAELVALLRRA